jgi:ATP-dependent RNA helicase RhlE
MMNFGTLGLNKEILDAVKAKNYEIPTPVQAQAIPVALDKKDLLVSAQTGTGKTAAFVLPMLQRLGHDKKNTGKHQLRGLILVPTRELAMQVGESVVEYGKNLPFTSVNLYGGKKIGVEVKHLEKGVDIIVATPGRLVEHIQQGSVKLDNINFFVLDEADRMLDMGFINEIRAIGEVMPKGRQTFMFSATFTPKVVNLGKSLLRKPKIIEVARQNKTAETIEQKVHFVNSDNKMDLLSYMIGSKNFKQVLVFTRTKDGTDNIAKELTEAGLPATAIHGDITQAKRTKALAQFKEGKFRVLVATDVAGRGLDIKDMDYVINYELPSVPEDYVHRIGRTGRAGKKGLAISLVSAYDVAYLFEIEKLIGLKMEEIKTDGYKFDERIPDRGEQHNQRDRRKAAKARKHAPKKEKSKKYASTQKKAKQTKRNRYSGGA